MDLRDAVGADRLPELCSTGSAENVTSWILDVQCALAKSAGFQFTPEHFGMPRGYNQEDEGILGIPGMKTIGGAPPRQPMQDLVQGAGPDSMAAYESAMAAAAVTRARNQRGSNIFG